MYSGDEYYGDEITSPTERPATRPLGHTHPPTVEQTAEALRGVRQTGTEKMVNLFLCAIERHYGAGHMKAAHALAGDLALDRLAMEATRRQV